VPPVRAGPVGHIASSFDRLARILATQPGSADEPATTEASRLVRPFVVQSHRPGARRDNTPTGLVRPYIRTTDTDTDRPPAR